MVQSCCCTEAARSTEHGTRCMYAMRAQQNRHSRHICDMAWNLTWTLTLSPCLSALGSIDNC